MNSQPKHPWCKKGCGQESKKGHTEKDVKGGQGLLLLMELKSLIMITRPQSITVVHQLLKVIVAGNSSVLQPGHHYQKFLFHQQLGALAAHFYFTSFSAWPF